MEKEQALAIQQIIKDFNAQYFSEACQKIDKLVENLTLIQKEQTRIYLYSLIFDQHHITDIERLPKLMLNFTTRLFPNIETMTPLQIETRWNQFASPEYIHLLNSVSAIRNNFPWFISLLKIKPTFASFYQAIDNHELPQKIIKYLPEFAWTVKNVRNPSSLPLC